MTVSIGIKKKTLAREARHKRVRKVISGTEARPRLSVYRSAKHIYAQIINDNTGLVLCSASTLCPEYKEKKKKIYTGNCASAKEIGTILAQKATKKGIGAVAFDKGGFLYHGRLKALADAAREAGLVF